MKGKIWELGPFALGIIVGVYFLAARLQCAPTPSGEKPRAGAQPRASSGFGDPTKPQDFLPDPNSQPDPNSLPDPTASTATRR